MGGGGIVHAREETCGMRPLGVLVGVVSVSLCRGVYIGGG